ncbi:Rhomboid- protein 4 [Phytophthora pseudosyringae]|uniref:Rhomboid- protein 4 n=1 Tax=Phytophthora pseudosyringae TaxID=221518 RepID=A0A8T1WQ53_9STRA|nr:Rhomboid- protein 4 [Phytophthora pseudosyringae]
MFGPNVGRRGRGMGPNAGRNGQGIALMLMLVRQIQQLERKPPVTLGLMALMYGLHFQKQQTPELFAPYSLCPDRVLSTWDLKRIVVSGLVHVDDWHLYHNMISFLWKGYNLEYKLGSVRFLLTVSYLLVLCHVLVVVVALVLATGFQLPGPLHQCSVGFSGVLFALKVLLNHNSPAFSSVYGFRVPTKYAAWLELVVIHFLVPRSSFMGHMCGILAGYIFVYSPTMQSALTSGASALSRWVKAVVGPVSNQHDTDRRAASPRSPTFSFETDEELARRFQEEEYRSQRAPQSQPGQPAPENISPRELRRRRMARFGNAQ